MANGRAGAKGRRDSGRDAGGFVALPWSVLDSEAYLGLSATARALLLEVARQYHRDDNGRMLLSRAFMLTRGWKSADILAKAKAELLAAGLIFQTVMGQRPNKASWFAVTWQRLDRIPGFDPGADKTFEQSAYKRVSLTTSASSKRQPPKRKAAVKNASLIPTTGTEKASIVPTTGTETPPPVPTTGTIRPVLGTSPVPTTGHPLEMPSAGVAGVGLSAVAGVCGVADVRRGRPSAAARPMTAATAMTPAPESVANLLDRLSSEQPASLLAQALMRAGKAG